MTQTPTILASHIQRCKALLAAEVDLPAVVRRLRAVLAPKEPEIRAKRLATFAAHESAVFAALAAEAMDRSLDPDPDGRKASALPINQDLLNFVALVTPSIRLRARAGSGKSTAIVIKCDFLIRLGVPPEAIQILTFNKAAADALMAKLAATLGAPLGKRVGVNTFHSLAWNVLKCGAATQGMSLNFKPEGSSDRDLKAQVSDLEKVVAAVTGPLDYAAYRHRYESSSHAYIASNPDFDASLVRFAAGAAALYRARSGTPGLAKSTPVAQHLARVVAAHEARLTATNTLDGEAGLRRAAEILSGKDALAQFKRLNGTLQYLFVDEYQDFSAAFEALVQGVVSRNPSCVINAVGDDWQSINAFMGADLAFFKGFKSRYPTALNLPLAANFRCGIDIVAFGNAVMQATDDKEKAVAARSHSGTLRVKVGGIPNHRRKKDEWQRDARAFLEDQIATMARYAWAEDARTGRAPGSMVLLAAQNDPYDQPLHVYAAAIDCPAGATVQVSTTHSSKGREWDHVILLDGTDKAYPSEHPADPAQSDLIHKGDKEAEGQRLLYVAVTRAIHSLAILAPTTLHARLQSVRDFARR